MPVTQALEALKRKDFAAARDLIAQEDEADFGIRHFLIKGLAELALKDWEAALDSFTAATGRFSDYALFWLNRGVAEENLRLIDEAIASQQQCLALDPSVAEAYGNLSNLYRRKKHFNEAEEMARQALAKGAPKGDALNCLALALCKQGRFDEAREIFRQAHREAPANATILANHANLEIDVFHFDEAWKLFAAARAIDDLPVFRHDEGLARLLAGDYERGLPLFESRLEMPCALRIHPPCPRWRGENLEGKKLLILAEQGFGDVIQFCRYQKSITEGELIWAVPKNLVRLLAANVRGKVLDETSDLPVCDYYVPILSLPLAGRGTVSPLCAPVVTPRREGGATLGALPAGQKDNNIQTPPQLIPPLPDPPREGEGIYISPPSTPLLPPGKHARKIGIVWAGSRTHERDHERSIPLDVFAPLFKEVEADFYAPFIGGAVDEIKKFPILRLDNLIADFADTAALLRQMDCLISVDTAVAHLAGAVGVKTFLLLSHCPDWRWGIEGSTTKGYPSLTIIRQPAYGDWKSVVEQLVALLKND